MQVEFYEDKSHEWRWRARADNGNIIADSSEGYANLADCESGLVALTTALRSSSARTVEIGKDGDKTIGALQALVAKHGVLSA